MSETIQPQRTIGHEFSRAVKVFLQTSLPGVAETAAAQTPVNYALTAYCHHFMPELPQASWWQSFTDSLPWSAPTFWGGLETTALALGGAFIADRQVKAKEDCGFTPDSPALKFIWQESIRLQLAGFGMGLGKFLAALDQWQMLGHSPNAVVFCAGYGASLLGGVISVADNFIFHQEKRNSLKELGWPLAAFGLSAAGFLLAPVEVKPQVAAFTVTAFGNLAENLIEAFGRGKQK